MSGGIIRYAITMQVITSKLLSNNDGIFNFYQLLHLDVLNPEDSVLFQVYSTEFYYFFAKTAHVNLKICTKMIHLLKLMIIAN